MVHVLAVDPVAASLSVLNLAVSAAITIVLFRVTLAQRRREREEDKDRTEQRRLDDQRNQEMAKLKNDLHSTAEKLVDERLRAMSHDLRGSIGALTATVDAMTTRLADSEEGLAGLGDRDHSREIQILQGLAQIKQHLAEQAATKTDLRDHQKEMSGRVDQLQRHLGSQDERLARIETQVQDRPAGRGSRA